MINIMLVDDHDLVRTGIKRLLEDNGKFRIVAEATSGEQALECIRQTNPQVVLMDINMPGIGGLEATYKLLKQKADLKIIIVSMHTDELFPQRVLKAGAMGYLTKGSCIDEIVHAIHEVLANRHYITPEIAQRLALSQVDENGASPFDGLSARELQVMLLMMEGKKINDISEELCLSPKTVSTYRHRLHDKVGVNSDVELARLALFHGLIENAPFKT
ncbi:BarA-associated response regulator UvrY (= GacA = SirA) [hydrothermal vent metagenome]|uniref:BarA-associated response regulator UvrY (= GacA = SirA) n=1 Tax=hydrothermal vent metagenome TaxID=652676 RepID=A0A3B1BH30_9ZZZZ